MKRDLSIIGIIPQYPKHSQQNIYARIKMPPVGILSVMSQITHHPRIKEIYAIDENNYNGPQDSDGQPDHAFLQAGQPAQIALFYGGMSNSIPRMYSVASQYKGFGAFTIAGGSHVDALPQEALQSGIDIVVHGEGEETILELLEILISDSRVLLNRPALSQVKGISFLDDNGAYIFTGKRQPIDNLDELADPDLTLIKFLKKRWSYLPINRARGCNWNCEFCIVNKRYGKYKFASIDTTLRQLIKYADLGYSNFFFTDDNFAQNPADAIALCRKIGDYKRNFRKKLDIVVQVRSEVAENDELRAMRKGVTAEKLIARSKILANYFYLHGMFIFGYPSSKDDSKRSSLTIKQRVKCYIDFFKKTGLDTIQVFNAVPLPGSDLRARLEKEGRLLPLSMVGWDKYDGLFLCYDPRPDDLDAFDLQNAICLLMKKKYLGGFIGRRLNYGNWMNWTYIATIGFPIEFSELYVRRFIRNLLEKLKAGKQRRIDWTPRTIFIVPLANAWRDIKRIWRNLFVKTYAGAIVTRWLKIYRESDYKNKLRRIFMNNQTAKLN